MSESADVVVVVDSDENEDAAAIATIASIPMRKLTDRALFFASWSAARRFGITADRLAIEWRDVSTNATIGSIALANVVQVARDRKRNADDKHGVNWFFQIVERAPSSPIVHSLSCDTELDMSRVIRAIAKLCGLHCSEALPKSLAPLTNSAESLSVVRNGWLSKRGEINTAFRRRWFVLRANASLSYAFGPKSAVSKGSIVLGDHDVEFPSALTPDDPTEFAVWTASRKFVLRAESAAVAAEWVALLRSMRTHHGIHSQSPLVINGDDSGAERDASSSSQGGGAFVLDDAPFNVATWGAFDVLNEFTVVAPTPRIPPVHPPAERSLMCANEALVQLDAEQTRRVGSALLLALDAGRNNFVDLPHAQLATLRHRERQIGERAVLRHVEHLQCNAVAEFKRQFGKPIAVAAGAALELRGAVVHVELSQTRQLADGGWQRCQFVVVQIEHHQRRQLLENERVERGQMTIAEVDMRERRGAGQSE